MPRAERVHPSEGPQPALFTDKAYTASSRYVLSTSNIGSSPMQGGFSPMYEDGYGVCYCIQQDKLLFSITASHACKDTDAAAFRDALERSLIDMQKVCLERNVMYVAESRL